MNALLAADTTASGARALPYTPERDTYRKEYVDVNWGALMPKADGTTTIVGYGGVDLTVPHMRKMVRKYSHQLAPIAQRLKARTHEQSAYHVWRWIKDNFAYNNDEIGKEQLRTPGRDWMDRRSGIDCDDFALLGAMLLQEMGLPWAFRVVGFHGKDGYQHVYLTSGPWVIDDVMNLFNIEPPNIVRRWDVKPDGSENFPLSGMPVQRSTISDGTIEFSFAGIDTPLPLSGFTCMSGGLSGIDGGTPLVGFEGTADTSPLTQKFIEKRSAILREIGDGNASPQQAAALRKLDAVVAFNDRPDVQRLWLDAWDYIRDVDPSSSNMVLDADDDEDQLMIGAILALFEERRQVEDELKTAENDLERARASRKLGAVDTALFGWNGLAWHPAPFGGLDGLDGKFLERRKRIRAEKKKIKSMPKGPARDAAWNKFKKERRKRIGKGFAKVGKFLMKVNPATAAIRGLFLPFLRMDAFKMATSYRMGTLTDAEYDKLGIDQDKRKKLRDNSKKIIRIWEGFGGSAKRYKQIAFKATNKKGPFKNLGKGKLAEMEAKLAAKKAAKKGYKPADEDVHGLMECGMGGYTIARQIAANPTARAAFYADRTLKTAQSYVDAYGNLHGLDADWESMQGFDDLGDALGIAPIAAAGGAAAIITPIVAVAAKAKKIIEPILKLFGGGKKKKKGGGNKEAQAEAQEAQAIENYENGASPSAFIPAGMSPEDWAALQEAWPTLTPDERAQLRQNFPDIPLSGLGWYLNNAVLNGYGLDGPVIDFFKNLKKSKGKGGIIKRIKRAVQDTRQQRKAAGKAPVGSRIKALLNRSNPAPQVPPLAPPNQGYQNFQQKTQSDANTTPPPTTDDTLKKAMPWILGIGGVVVVGGIIYAVTK